MKKTITMLALSAALLICCGSSTLQAQTKSYIFDESGFLIRVLENNVFYPGEKYSYDVYYGVIPAGSAGIEIKSELVTYRDAPCYEINTWAKSAKGFDWFFKVRDRVLSYMDSRGIFTWYFEKELHEGKYHDLKQVDYDQRTGFAYTASDSVPKDTSNIPLYVQDAITAMHYFRLQDLKVGKPIYIQVHDITKTYPLRIDVIGRETVEVPLGTFDCYKIEPSLESAGIFKSTGRIFIWFTADKYKIPVMLSTKILIGSITAYMKEYEAGKPILSGEIEDRR
ncbi:DUF3108 domain-containing protein [bacterium]|nr:DUF3108 domain-containing protein [bacterium]MBU1652670.1 DUF3108 domain-containing protein [bacterium]MBU1882030.1 DUF3108 domain-containing protein [bacterium]